VGPRAGMHAKTKRKIPCPCRESKPDRQAHNLVNILSELSRLPTNEDLAYSIGLQWTDYYKYMNHRFLTY